ncbi:membrane-associated protein, putative [Bodo saltans]|uniref:Membrane-associated protein, putative n=1 Tax=Bodo saltans TaxID=75058 RepID=A0A0S4IQL2_BODSA|nr:membrane-associated protein, putative [Bodo saltans]|eukprot:CUF24413.1 membrane-associated protein, putative [Bodo saltans]
MREKVIAHFCVMILAANFLSQPAVAPATPAAPNLNYTRSTDSSSREMTATIFFFCQ